MNITVISISAPTARTGNWATCTSSTTASPVTTSDILRTVQVGITGCTGC